MPNKYIYMDNNATTQLDEEVASFMWQNISLYGNASSMHGMGRESEAAIQWSRLEVAKLLDCDPDGVYFTSGATESNNTVLNTFREEIDKGGKRDCIIVSTIEHPAIIEMCKYLIKKGYKIDFAPVDSTGMIKMDVLKEMMGDDVILVSVMVGNNETGTIQPVKEIAQLAHSYGAYMHTDATQAMGKIPVSCVDLDCDYLSLSAHKFYGPKGIGVLYVRKKAPLVAYLKGGHQEKALRAGTYNTLGIIGLGKASELAYKNLSAEHDQLWFLRERLRKGIIAALPETVVNGNQEHCLPGTLDVSFPAAEGESILLYLDLEGIEVSTGSACASGSLEPSYVLLASGLDIELAHGSIRFSLGRYNTEAEVDYVIEVLPKIIKKIRSMSTRKA